MKKVTYMNKLLRILLITFLVVFALVGMGYLALLEFYQVHIPYGTWINGIYCTGISYDEAATLLLEDSTYIPELRVVDAKGNSYKLVLPENSYEMNYRTGLENAIVKEGIFSEKHIEIIPTIFIDEEAFANYMQSQQVVACPEIFSGDERLQILKEEDGFRLADANTFTLDVGKAKQAILESFQKGEKLLILSEKDCYYKPAYSDVDNMIYEQYIKLLEFCYTFSMELTIEGEVAYTVDASVLKDWILTRKDGTYATQKDGSFQLDKAQVKEYAKQISKEVSTCLGKPWLFTNHNGESVEVKAGNYGRALNTDALYKALLNGFSQGEQAKLAYELEFDFYPKTAKDVQYGAGLGSSYVEVDIEEQKIYVYVEDELVFTSDCVTGDVRRHRQTPDGVFYVEYKQRNRVLKGEDYRTPVNYWMHFYNHCGFHDAVWRKSFGDDIYLNDGSHGCINMPPEKAKELYEIVYKGIPVVIY